VDPSRRLIAALLKKAYLRQGPFSAINRTTFPPFCRILGEIDEVYGIQYSQAVYLQLVRDIHCYSVSEHRDAAIQKKKSEAVEKKPDSPPMGFSPFHDSSEYRKACGDATRRLQKEILVSSGWKRRSRTRFETNTQGGTLLCFFDLGTWRGSLDLELQFPDIRFRVPAYTFFWLDLRKAFTFQDPELYGRNLETVLKLVLLLERCMNEQ